MTQRREPVAVGPVLRPRRKREAALGEGGPQVAPKALEKWLGLWEVGVIGGMGATRITRGVGITRTETTIKLGTESVLYYCLCYHCLSSSGTRTQTSSGIVQECPTGMAILGRMGK